jgi:hypothetical protein
MHLHMHCGSREKHSLKQSLGFVALLLGLAFLVTALARDLESSVRGDIAMREPLVRRA